MMYSNQGMVHDFHVKQGMLVPDEPTLPDYDTIETRFELIKEEYNELANELLPWPGSKRDLNKIAHEAADLLYVVYGLAVECGFDLDAVLYQIHRANMTKDRSPKGEKAVKGPNFVPAKVNVRG